MSTPPAHALAESLQEALGSIRASNPTHGANPPEIVRRWASGDLWRGIPEEFHGAELSDGLKSKLNTKPRPFSFALVGPPGTGKTRALWAMTHSMRLASSRRLMGAPVERRRVVPDGESSSRMESIGEAIDRCLAASAPLRIITEVGQIRACRYDRDRLANWTNYPGWLAVDDIGAVEPNEWVREAVYHMANERRGMGRTTVWTSNLNPQKIRDVFGAAIASRILGGVVIETSGADRRLA